MKLKKLLYILSIIASPAISQTFPVNNLTATGTINSTGAVTAPTFIGNLTGTATSASTVTAASQPAITSVGTLTGLNLTIPLPLASGGTGTTGFNQSGTGAVTRSWLSKNQDIVSSSDYSTGTQAITALGSTGTLLVPNGQSTTLPTNFPGKVVNYQSQTSQNVYSQFDSGRLTSNLIRSQYGTHSGTQQIATFGIENIPTGSGFNGAANADMSLNISNIKNNYLASSQQGEIDGINVVTRQGGPAGNGSTGNSDTAGILIDVGIKSGSGWAGALEASTTLFNSGGSSTKQLQTQVGVLDSTTSNYIGFAAIAGNGEINDGIRLLSSGTGYFDNFESFFNTAGVKVFQVNNAGGITLSAPSGSTPTKTIRSLSGQLSVLNDAQTSQILLLDDTGNLTTTGLINSTGVTATGAINVTTSNVVGSVVVTDSGGNGANIKLIGNGSTTPNKFIRSQAGGLDIINSGYSASIFHLDDLGNTNIVGSLSAPSASFSTPLPASSGGTGAIGFNQIGTGEILRSWTSKAQEIVSAKDFGAICNGSSHPLSSLYGTLAAAQVQYPFATSLTQEIDGMAIQSAINSYTGGVTGGVIHLGIGVCLTSIQLNTLDKANLYIKGEGINATVIKPANALTSIFALGNSGTANIGISDLLIDNTAFPTTNGIIVSNINTFAANNFVINNANIGLQINNGVIQYYTNFGINLSVTAGIYIHGGNDQYFVNGVLSSAGSTQPTTAGIWSDQNDAFWLVNVDAISQNTGLLLNPGNGQYISWPFVMNCAFDTGNGYGISLAPTGTGNIRGGTFTGDWTSTNQLHGFNIGGTGTVNGIRVIGHRSFNNVQSGYEVSNTGATNIEFNSDDAAGNSVGTFNTYSGFDIGPGVSGFSITNSRSGFSSGQANSQSRGIIVNPGSSNNYLIEGNDLRGNTTSLLDLGTGSSKIIRSNLGYNPTVNSTVTVTGSPFTWTNNTGDTVLLFINGGTVSNVSVAGNQVLSSTNGSTTIPQGGSAIITYTSTPIVSYNGL